MDKKEAYEAYIKPSTNIGYGGWLNYFRQYRDPEKMKKLEKSSKEYSLEYAKQSLDPGLESMVIEEKLEALINAEIAKEDEEFRRYNKALYEEEFEILKEIKGGWRDYFEKKRRQWWKQQYSKADIRILDDRFSEVLEMLIPPEQKNAEAEQ